MALEQWWYFHSFVLFLLLKLCNSTDTITPTQSITGDDILVSKGENFELGFFSPGNSKFRYVGIWSNKVPEQTVVWVANRDNPIKDSAGILTINGDGNLVVFDGDPKSPLWSTNVSKATNYSTAKLLDSGNLVLTSSGSHGNLWESFDYPTHTWLPQMKLGLNRKTGLNMFLTSWKSIDDPGRGDYSFRLDPKGSHQFFLYEGSAPYWRSGPWIDQGWSGIPEMTKSSLLKFSFEANDDEISMSYIILNSSVFSRFVLDESGRAQRQTSFDRNLQWHVYWSLPQDTCDNYRRCGEYGRCNSGESVECQCLPGFEPSSPSQWYLRDWSEGCVRKRTLGCGKGDGFLKLLHVKLPDTSVSRVNMYSSLEDCKKECLRNCSCTGYAREDTRGGVTTYVAWYGALEDIRGFIDGGQDFYLRADAVELAQASRNSRGFLGDKLKVVILMVSLVVGILFLVLCGYYLLKKRKTKAEIEMRPQHERPFFDFTTRYISCKDYPGANELEENRTNSELLFFEPNVMVAATDNFSSSNTLGEGGFGIVYKGQLFNGQEIAVKRLSKNSGQGMEEFTNEVMLIAKLQHRNLVRLLGCCIQEEEKMLIYEYMPNKSLDTFIFDQSRKALLDWRKRFEIIVGIARGILYLHQDSRLRVIHRDLKSSNVLLDDEMNPKISDFGMARIFGGNQTQANTNRLVGTYGYMSPEYAMEGLFSIKSDVFSFGVILLEIISGKKNNDYYHAGRPLNLIGHAWDLWKEDRALDITDSSMSDLCPANEVLRCIQIGLLCVQENASDRPTMSSVVFMLVNETTMPPPNRPAFFMRETLKETNSSSINVEMITTVEAR